MHRDFYFRLKLHIQIIVLALAISIFHTYPSRSQTSDIYAQASLAEKIYLQLDSKVYTTDNTIWFKAIVANASNHVPTRLSGVLYVELIGSNEKVVETKVIKLHHGIGSGFFELNQHYPEGLYLVRAYTEWNRNFDEDFFFKEYIHVFPTTSTENTKPIGDITLEKHDDNEHILHATIDPFAIDSLHKRDVTVFVALNNKKDSLSIKKGKDNKYQMDYAVPDTCQFLNLQIRTKNRRTYSKTIALDEEYLDLQFFPESGELVHGLQCTVGFKAIGHNGKGREVEGEIINENGEILTYFKSNELGMGSFTLIHVDSADFYSARVISGSDEQLPLKFPLPKIAHIGNVLSVNKAGSKIRLIASSNYMENDSIYFRGSCRGIDDYEIKGRLKEGVLRVLFPSDKLPEGIIAFTMMDASKQPVAERLFFNERPESRLNITISMDKKRYTQREKTSLNIVTIDKNGKKVNSSKSILVLNKSQMGEMQNMRQNILSHFLLSSDLKGEIESPGLYFKKGIKTHEKDLDVLLLTQGWRKYLYTRPMELDHFRHQPEAGLSVSGTVGGILNKKKRRQAELTMMTFGEVPSAQSQITDSLDRFNFGISDAYGNDVGVLIQSAKKSGKKQNYTITLDGKKSPNISFDHLKEIEGVDSVNRVFIEKNIERKNVEESFRLSSDIMLDEVVIEEYRMTPERQKIADAYGKPDIVIDGEEIREKEAKWSYGLYSVLLFNFPGKVRILTIGGDLYAQATNPEPTLVVIDGIPVAKESYPLIPYIPPSEVKSFEIIEYAKNFFQLFMEVFPRVHPLDVPHQGNVIAIYTYAGKGLYGVQKPIGIVQASVPAFSTQREFYAPKYEKLTPDDWIKPDLRALVHWEPQVVVDSLGKHTTSFYNTDNVGEMLVVVEAISENGEIGYQEVIYNVEEKRSR